MNLKCNHPIAITIHDTELNTEIGVACPECGRVVRKVLRFDRSDKEVVDMFYMDSVPKNRYMLMISPRWVGSFKR